MLLQLNILTAALGSFPVSKNTITLIEMERENNNRSSAAWCTGHLSDKQDSLFLFYFLFFPETHTCFSAFRHMSSF